ncbi:MAG: multiple sugar transport system ATP-binding protein [Thermomicrobiales bacterium]|jgi:ABC-type sugar transport system ATPase subunit|nr:multiple sugar transport system ATP-binding protein [Thermomicrobiales bacterium]
MARVTLEHLSKHFGTVKAVDDLSLEIPEGSFVTLLGPSGCGKSTTLYCIAGLEEPTAGSIYFDGTPVTDLSPKDRDAALVFQDYALYPHMSVEDNLAFALKMRKTAKGEAKQRVQQVAKLLGIEQLLNRRPVQLSGGQRQRVALGRALVRNATVFLMDEPLSNLDALLRVNTRTEIKRLQRELGKTTIFVTHDQEEAMVLSDRIAIMRDGVLQQYSTPEETYNAPANTFVAGFIGSPRMNFVKGKLASDNGRVVLDAGTLTMTVPGERARALAGPSQRDVTLGIRPEHLVLGPPASGATVARVELIEPVGPVTYLDLALGDRSLRASVNGTQRYTVGQEVAIGLEPESLHFFDAESGNRIGLAG